MSSKQQQQHLESNVAVVVSSNVKADLKENKLAMLGTKLNENFQRRMNFGDVST